MKNKKSTQNLFGLRTFGKYSLQTDKAELAFFSVQPTNISVLSAENIDVKIYHLMMLLSMIPELEIICLDSCECFDGNKVHIKNRLKSEENPNVRKLLKQDVQRALVALVVLLYVPGCQQLHNHGEVLLLGRGLMDKVEYQRH